MTVYDKDTILMCIEGKKFRMGFDPRFRIVWVKESSKRGYFIGLDCDFAKWAWEILKGVVSSGGLSQEG